MRLAVGFGFNRAMNNRAELSKKWFQCGKRELALYRRLKIRRWKNRLPTYDSDQFDPAAHSWDEIAQAMCQAELVHEVIVVLSFVPVFFSGRFGALPVFVITSVLAAAFDLLFVMIQRYNRSRVVRLIRRKKSV